LMEFLSSCKELVEINDSKGVSHSMPLKGGNLPILLLSVISGLFRFLLKTNFFAGGWWVFQQKFCIFYSVMGFKISFC
jgi:hypothetical protein